MGFFRDWAAHWRGMASNSQRAAVRFVAAPLSHVRAAITSPFSFAFWFFIVMLYFNSVTSVITERQGVLTQPPLPDQGHDWFPKIGIEKLADWLLFGYLAAFALRFLPLWPCVKPAVSLMIIRRWFLTEGVIFFFRGATVAMTSHPAPNPSCVSTATGNIWAEAVYITFGVHHTCADCMFSGHTAAITLLTLLWTHYSRGEELAVFCGTHQGCITPNVDAVGDPMGWKLIDLPLWSWSLFCYYAIIATRFHYSSDVFMGFCLTFFFFKWYHFYLKNLSMRSGSVLSRFMRWFEGIALAEENLVKTQALMAAKDLEAGRPGPSSDHKSSGSPVPADVKSNTTIGGGSPPAPAFLPVSYLVGHEYYRAGGDDAAKASKDHSLQAGSAAAAAGLAKNEDSPGAGSEPLQAGQFEHDNTVRIHAPARDVDRDQQGAETVAAGGGVSHDRDSGYPALHNAQMAVPVLVPGEQAEQERREIEVEHGVPVS